MVLATEGNAKNLCTNGLNTQLQFTDTQAIEMTYLGNSPKSDRDERRCSTYKNKRAMTLIID